MVFRYFITALNIALFSILIFPINNGYSEPKSKKEATKQKTSKFEGSMTIEKMDKIIKRLDTKAISNPQGLWRLVIEKVPVMIITDQKRNRMRILVPIKKANQLTPKELKRIMQANFDSVLDSRYAIAKDILWAAYIHPLTELHEKQFISAIGQTVNTALTYGTTYSSGAVVFGGGDSNAIIRRQLIDKLIKKGLKI